MWAYSKFEYGLLEAMDVELSKGLAQLQKQILTSWNDW